MKKQKCYCSFCKNERLYIKKRHLGIRDLLFCALAAVLLNFILWQKLDPRLMFMFAVFCLIGETLVRIRHRLSMICPYCSFDPVLYLKNPEKMSERVATFMQSRKAATSYALSAKQFDKLASFRKPKEDKKEKQAEA